MATERFCPVSLGDWLSLCEEAKVPYVPAEKVAEFLRDDCLAFDQDRPDVQGRLRAVYEKLQAARQVDYMMRFDCCSVAEVKYRLGQGEPEWREEFLDLPIDDMRGFDIIFEYPREVLPVWKRPWMATQIVDAYPVEFRVFVQDGKVAGVSSYYPQRPLPEDGQHYLWASVASGLAHRLADTARSRVPFEWHNTFGKYPADGVHFTADFLVTLDARVLFLEGGPPHELGAHPCCFRPGEIEGVAFADRNEESVNRRGVLEI